MHCYSSIDVPLSPKEPFTDYSRWRLLVNDDGRQTWHYLETDEECAAWSQNTVDMFWLGLPTNIPTLPRPKNALQAAQNGYTFYKNLQSHDGHWAGHFGGPMFLLPGLVIGSYISGMGFKNAERLEMIRWIMNRANTEDGGWGIHVEGHSTVFGTALNYVTLRILGMSPNHPCCVKSRATLHKIGGACGIPSWGKFWLSLLNVYDWEGNNPIPPEALLLPESLSFHPSKWWIQTRNVYVPMSYLYGLRVKAPENDLILALREELYPPNQSYYSIHWPSQRNNISPVDLYAPHSLFFDAINKLLSTYELCAVTPICRAALDKAYRLIVMEDENTSYQTIAPVSKMFNLVARVWTEGLDSEVYRLHEEKRADFMWVGPEGMLMSGTNGSQLWDTAFIMQAVCETGPGLCDLEENQASLVKALEWIEGAQMLENPKWWKEDYRHQTKGGWSFSTKEQGYVVSDCTGEAVKAVMLLQELDFTRKLVSEERLCWAVDTMISLQNPNGGFASFELVRAPHWLEKLNPAEVFGEIMTDYCYPECTASVITALSAFRKQYPSYRSKDIETTTNCAITYLHSSQHLNGGWIGSWGICFTYATMFACEALALAGENYDNSAYVKRACKLLIGKQREDGGWGESYKSCEVSEWVEHPDSSQVVQTCWAMMALMYGGYPDVKPIESAVKLVIERQLDDGSWPQEAIEGIFNKNCAIAYPNFKFAFPIWMLGKAHPYLQKLKGETVHSTEIAEETLDRVLTRRRGTFVGRS